MAWRIHDRVVRGVLDNRVRGIVRGQIWLVGRVEPVEIEVEGNPWRDLAGHRIEFVNPEPRSQPHPTLGTLDGLRAKQTGVVGDMTASRKSKVVDCSDEEFERHYKEKTPFPWHWGNCLYLEWFGDWNGRVVIESAGYTISIDDEPAWTMSEEDEEDQRERNAEAITRFMERLGAAAAEQFARESDDPLDGIDLVSDDDDMPRSEAEAEADAEDARMNLLLDRVQNRIHRQLREGVGTPDFDAIYEEERERLRVERGEPLPRQLTPEEEAERAEWIAELNAAAESQLEEYERSEERPEHERNHPLVLRCTELGLRIAREIKAGNWIDERDHPEHPIRLVTEGVLLAGPKLAGALNGSFEDGEWPPCPLFAGDVLVRLKKSRRLLSEALLGLESAREGGLASADWLVRTQHDVRLLFEEVNALIVEVRVVLGDEP